MTVLPEVFTADEIMAAAQQLPMRIRKRKDGDYEIREVSFDLTANSRFSKVAKERSKIDLDAAVSNNTRRQLGDFLAGALRNRMRENRGAASSQFGSAQTRRWMEKMKRCYADPDLRRKLEETIEFHMRGLEG